MFSISAEVFSIFWLSFLGATIGSFLNVVVYRLPRGRTLLGRSRCPYCWQEIPFYDNLPVIGWLLLRGRCRTCRLEISPRYPLVEFIMGAIFLLLGVAYIALDGATIPRAPIPRYVGFAWHMFEARPSMMLLFLGHAFVLTILVGATLVRMDGHRVPWLMIFVMFVLSVVLAVGSPGLPGRDGIAIGAIGSGFMSSGLGNLWKPLLGLGTGWVMGGLSEWVLVAVARERTEIDIRSMLLWAFVGLAFGFPSMLSISLLSTLGIIVRQIVPPIGRIPFVDHSLGLLFIASLVHEVTWFLWARLPGWPWEGQRWQGAVAWGISAIVILLFIRWQAYWT